MTRLDDWLRKKELLFLRFNLYPEKLPNYSISSPQTGPGQEHPGHGDQESCRSLTLVTNPSRAGTPGGTGGLSHTGVSMFGTGWDQPRGISKVRGLALGIHQED